MDGDNKLPFAAKWFDVVAVAAAPIGRETVDRLLVSGLESVRLVLRSLEYAPVAVELSRQRCWNCASFEMVDWCKRSVWPSAGPIVVAATPVAAEEAVGSSSARRFSLSSWALLAWALVRDFPFG